MLLTEAVSATLLRDAIAAALAQAVARRGPVLVHYLAQYDEPVRWTSLYLPLVEEGGAAPVASVVAGMFHERGTPAGALQALHAEPGDEAAAMVAPRAPL